MSEFIANKPALIVCCGMVYWKLVVSTIPLDCFEKLDDEWIASPGGKAALWFWRIEE